MSEENLRFYTRHAEPPQHALKQITFGALRGKTDIKPQWRLRAMTDMFGPIGVGWYYETTRLERFESPDGQVAVFATVKVYLIDEDGKVTPPIEGTGGNKVIARSKEGLHLNDEAEKMAITDALSVAFKQIGIASSIYEGLFDGSKYAQPDYDEPPARKASPKKAAPPKAAAPAPAKVAEPAPDDPIQADIAEEAIEAISVATGKADLEAARSRAAAQGLAGAHMARVMTAIRDRVAELQGGAS